MNYICYINYVLEKEWKKPDKTVHFCQIHKTCFLRENIHNYYVNLMLSNKKSAENTKKRIFLKENRFYFLGT